MALGEFQLIDRFFRRLGAARSDVVLGVGDDAAVLRSPPGEELVVATDTLVEGVHFPKGSAARSIGHRALAVNLSDLAAMGARPAWATLALTLPAADEGWLAEFAAGFEALALRHGVALVGGDTTSGPLAVTVTLLGHAAIGTALTRSGASPGDRIFVSGTPGDAAAGLALIERRLEQGTPGVRDELLRRFLFPEPRVDLGYTLLDFASAVIDISDGLAADAGKLAAASGCGARIEADRLPLSKALLECAGEERTRLLALTGGDDYELLFAVPPARLAMLEARLAAQACRTTAIGVLREEPGLEVRAGAQRLELPRAGFDHFLR